MSRIDKEFGQYDDDDEIIAGSLVECEKTSLELEDDCSFAPSTPSLKASTSSTHRKPLLYYIATIQAFLIIYRTEVFLAFILAVSLTTALSSFLSHHFRNSRVDPFQAAKITHDYATTIKSKYDFTLGSIDHWCLNHGGNMKNDNDQCQCEDPLEPVSKRSSHKWEDQHKENMKVATGALMKITAASGEAVSKGKDLLPYDELWLDKKDDDWIVGKGRRFGDDDIGYLTVGSGSGVGLEDYDYDDGYGIPQEKNDEDQSDSKNDVMPLNGNARKRFLDYFVGRRTTTPSVSEAAWTLDVVFVGDSITEQRQGTSLGKEVTDYVAIQEVFEKTFSKKKGGDFNAIAMGIAGDTNGEMPFGLDPKVWWLGIGINDLSMKGCSEEVVLLGILRVVEEIQSSHPNAIIVINSLLPVRRNENGLLEHTGKNHEHKALKSKENNLQDSEMNPKRMHIDLWPSIVSINEELSRFASEHPKVKFFNADQVFVDERDDGKYLKLDLMGDNVHPNLSGHKKWNNAIKKRLHEILKDEP